MKYASFVYCNLTMSQLRYFKSFYNPISSFHKQLVCLPNSNQRCTQNEESKKNFSQKQNFVQFKI